MEFFGSCGGEAQTVAERRAISLRKKAPYILESVPHAGRLSGHYFAVIEIGFDCPFRVPTFNSEVVGIRQFLSCILNSAAKLMSRIRTVSRKSVQNRSFLGEKLGF